MNVIEIYKLTRSFGDLLVVNDLTLAIPDANVPARGDFDALEVSISQRRVKIL